VSVSFGASRIDPTFGNPLGNHQNGTSVAVGVGLAYGDRKFVWEPTRGTAASLTGSFGMTILDSGTVLTQAVLAAGINHIIPLADGQGLVIGIGGALSAGDLKLPRQVTFLSLTGYAPDSFPSGLPGRASAQMTLEYRHVWVHSLDINLLHALYIRGIGGGLFAGAGLVTTCESYAITTKSPAVNVGYALRFFGDWFGVSQTTFNIGFGVPLILHDSTCFGSPVHQSTPLGFFFYFGPP
jgi:hypothetical protein